MNTLAMSIGDILKNTLDRVLIRSTDDFMQMEKCQIGPGLTELQLECEGYSLFKPEQALQNFMKFLQILGNQVKSNQRIQIKTVKITLNGFKLNPKDNYLQKLAKIMKMMELNMKTLWIHTSDLSGVRLSDFKCLYNLIAEIGGKQNFNFQDFSLQCANWTFEENQPQFQQLKGVFKQSLQDIAEIGYRLHQKHVRIEISGWYYNILDAQYFLDFRMTDEQLKNIKQKQRPKYSKYNKAKNTFSVQLFDKALEVFHLQMQNLISKLAQIMEDIQQLQIDMRNTHELLKTKKLKERLLSTVTKTNRVNKSMISMRNKQKIQEAADKEKQFRLNIMM